MLIEQINIGDNVTIKDTAYGFKGFKGKVVDETGIKIQVKFKSEPHPHAFDKKDVTKL